MKRLLVALLPFALAACEKSASISDLKDSSELNAKTDASVGIQVVVPFRPEKVKEVIIGLASLSDAEFQALNRDQKVTWMKKVLMAFQSMSMEDYYSYSPDQPDRTGGIRGYSKDQADLYGQRLARISSDVSSILTPAEMDQIQKLKAGIPYFADLEKQKLSNVVFQQFDGVKQALVAYVVKNGGAYPPSIEDLGLADNLSSVDGVSSWSMDADGLIKIILNDRIHDGASISLIPYKENWIDQQTGESKLDVKWKCMISPSQASRFRPDGCIE